MYEMEIPLSELRSSVNHLQGRIEWKAGGKFSESFVDTNIVNRLTQPKNQLIFGRRGTGKTHLLGRLKEYYLDKLEEDRILPVLMDGRTISNYASDVQHNSGLSILMIYRGFLEKILVGVEDFMADDITPGFFHRIFPNKEKQKMQRVEELITELRSLISKGEVVLKMGTVKAEENYAVATSRKKETGAKVDVSAGNNGTADITAGFIANLSKVSSKV